VWLRLADAGTRGAHGRFGGRHRGCGGQGRLGRIVTLLGDEQGYLGGTSARRTDRDCVFARACRCRTAARGLELGRMLLPTTERGTPLDGNGATVWPSRTSKPFPSLFHAAAGRHKCRIAGGDDSCRHGRGLCVASDAAFVLGVDMCGCADLFFFSSSAHTLQARPLPFAQPTAKG